MLDNGDPPIAIEHIEHQDAKIIEIPGGFQIDIEHVELDSEREPDVKLAIEIERVPITITEGDAIGHPSPVIADLEHSESEKVQRVLQAARDLREVDIMERPRRIMELIRDNVDYAFDQAIKELRTRDEELAQFVEDNLSVHSTGEVKASQIIDAGYGICRHLAALAVILAKEAEINASFEQSRSRNEGDGFVNINRGDTGEQLFKSYEAGEIFSTPHSWVGFEVDGRWIPMDPATKLCGDNATELETFRQANYSASFFDITAPADSIEVTGLPKCVYLMNFRNLEFPPDQATRTGVVVVKQDRQRNIGIFDDNSFVEEEPMRYSGPLRMQIFSTPNTARTNIRILSVQLVK